MGFKISLVPERDYISTPIIDLWKENPDLMRDLMNRIDDGLHMENFDYDKLPEKSKRIFSMVSPELYMKVVELFLAKFLYVNNLEFTEEAVEMFKNDFLR